MYCTNESRGIELLFGKLFVGNYVLEMLDVFAANNGSLDWNVMCNFGHMYTYVWRERWEEDRFLVVAGRWVFQADEWNLLL
jgi:hypothetical protein